MILKLYENVEIVNDIYKDCVWNDINIEFD